MSLKTLKNITPAELKSKGVVSLADKPNVAASYGVGGLSPTALKLWFDQLSKLLSDKINAIQDVLSSNDAAEYIKLDLEGLDSSNETGVYSLKDLCDALKDGKFVEYVKARSSAAADELQSLQAIINEFAADISTANENASTAASNAEDALNNSIETVTVMYQAATSGTTPPTGEWLTAIPSVPEGGFLWTQVVMSFHGGTSHTFYSVGKIGAKGDDVYSFAIQDGNLLQIKAGAADDDVSYGIDEYGELSVKLNY